MKRTTMLSRSNLRKGFLFIGTWALCGAVVLHAQRMCGTEMPDYEALRVSDPEAYAHAMRFEERVRASTRLMKEGRVSSAHEVVVRIPVVFHVLYNTPAQNVPEAKIQALMNTLNADFRARNGDRSRVPEEFSSLIADMKVEFYLADEDPDGNPTDGIHRVSTDKGSFGWFEMERTSTGGADGWDCDRYLNIWLGNLSLPGGIVAYANPPHPIPIAPCVIQGISQGVVMNYRDVLWATGRGRLATHEVGHWLGGLKHPWGRDSSPGCTGDDGVDDTPVQRDHTSGCPSSPRNTCPEPGSDMFMNYMDYTAGRCQLMFSLGQKVRTRAHMEMYLDTFLAASDGGGDDGDGDDDEGVTAVEEDLEGDIEVKILTDREEGTVAIEYFLERESQVSIRVYDSWGVGVQTYATEEAQATGSYRLTLTPTLPGGVYIYVLKTEYGRRWGRVLKP